MEVKTFIPNESYRPELEELLFQLSGKKRSLDLTPYPNVFTVGAFDEKKLIGFAQLFVLPKTTFKMGQLEDIVVHTNYRGHGIGTKILDEVISLARKQDCTVINLTTRPERKEAWALFESRGFTQPGNFVFRLNLKTP